MSADNAFFANNSIRYIALYSECKLTDKISVVLTHLTSASRCSSIFCYTIHVLPNTWINIYKYGLVYSFCQSCKGKHKPVTITSFWILDSGALLYFIGKISDFESFETLYILLPIQTANGSTYLIEKGTITLRHLNIQKNMVETIINDVFLCNDLILSLGAFLLNGLIILGIRDLITIKTLSQTSFGHISTNSSTIPTVSKPA